MTTLISALNVLPRMRNFRSEYLLVESSPSRAGWGANKSMM